jgi:DNA topoisomerase-1
MKLVIVESPSKSKTISKYLGKGYKVVASKGHLVDLPKSSLGVDIEKNFEPKYVVTKPTALKKIKDEAKSCNTIILAVDLDREGEAIGWHIANRLGIIEKDGKIKKGKNLIRIVFSEISKKAIHDALNNPRGIDMNLVNAQQARRILDRLVGYKLSPLLWKKIQFGLSAGRVQSVALRLIVEKEEERNKFSPEEFWKISVLVDTKKIEREAGKKFLFADNEKEEEKLNDQGGLIAFSLSKFKGKNLVIGNEEEARKIIDTVSTKDIWSIDSVSNSQSQRNPSPPLITSTLQRNAINRFGYSAKRTMSIAQKLYEQGLITYMRTDSIHMSEGAVSQARKYIEKHIGKNYLNDKIRRFKAKSKNAQEAHECIRPVDFSVVAEDLSLSQEEKNIYKLIWGYALATQMRPAIIEKIKAEVNIDDYVFEAHGSRLVFDGFMKVVPVNFTDKILPKMSKLDNIYPVLYKAEQKFTVPPARYTEASLIKKLEDLGIGRPSTYVSIISTIISRKYVEKQDRYLVPTDMGIVVNALLTKHFKKIVDYNFTAKLEGDLDSIARGEKDWKEMLKNFYIPFEEILKEKEKTITRDEFKILGEADKSIKCPKCRAQMVIKLGKNGRFLSCINFPECDGIRSVDGKTAEEIEKEATSKEFLSVYKPAPLTEDGRRYVLKEGRFGRFWAHPDYPKVKDSKPLEYTDDKIKELFGEPPQTEDGRNYILKKGRFGEFWAHPDYPKVKDIKKVAK